ncbi:MAG: DUF418 domain-containing protein, partial [Phycisphaerales bacterium]
EAGATPPDERPAGPADAAAGGAEPESDFARTPFGRFLRAAADNQIQQGPASPVWVATETEAYRHGPWVQSFLFRAASWVSMLFVGAMGFWWQVAAMMLFGAALLKSGFFAPEGRASQARWALVGFGLGLPLNTLSVLLPQLAGPERADLAAAFSMPLTMLVGPLLSIGYVSGWLLLSRLPAFRVPAGLLANVGRMALTNYLTQTVVATFIFYHWGLALFGTTTRGDRLLMALGIFTAQIVISAVWLRYFRFGPVEWVWRTVTYLRRPPLLRGAEGPANA